MDELGNMKGAQELDLTAAAGEVIDPKTVAQAITDSAAAEDTPEPGMLMDSAAEIMLGEEKETGLQIIDDTKKEKKKEDNSIENEDKKVIPTGDGEPETFKVLAQHFSEEGILDGFDEEMENTPEAFQEMVETTVQKGINDYKENFVNPLSQQFLEFIENNGDPGQFMSLVNGPDYQNISTDSLDSSEGMQKQVLRALYAEQGETPEDIEDTIQAFEDAGNLERRSKVALGKLQKMQASKVQEL